MYDDIVSAYKRINNQFEIVGFESGKIQLVYKDKKQETKKISDFPILSIDKCSKCQYICMTKTFLIQIQIKKKGLWLGIKKLSEIEINCQFSFYDNFIKLTFETKELKGIKETKKTINLNKQHVCSGFNLKTEENLNEGKLGLIDKLKNQKIETIYFFNEVHEEKLIFRLLDGNTFEKFEIGIKGSFLHSSLIFFDFVKEENSLYFLSINIQNQILFYELNTSIHR